MRCCSVTMELFYIRLLLWLKFSCIFHFYFSNLTDMSDRLTMEALEQHQHDGVPRQRRRSSIKPEGSESTAPGLVGPNFRRMSRIEPRTSVQYGLSGRRPSQASRRTSISGTSQGTKHHVIPVRLQNTYRDYAIYIKILICNKLSSN